METAALKELVQGYWRFAREFTLKKGDIEATLAVVGSTGWNAEGLAICRGLRERGIDPAAFWAFHNLIWHDLMTVEQITPQDVRELKAAMNNAFLAVVLVTDEQEPLEQVEQDILTILSQAGHRLTTNGILTALDSAGIIHGESTVKKYLSIMNDGKHLINNDQKCNPKGYGLPGW